ncbi:MAG: gamma-glutamyltransferase [Alphaproteobacteria bacterium]
MNKSPFPSVHAARSVSPLGRFCVGARQCGLAGLALLLAACGTGGGGEGAQAVAFGGAAADEPRAAQVAREVLADGGSAADAAVALYFALAVTRPSQAGLGAGGACISWDRRDPTVRAINFKQPPSATGGPEVAPPGGPRAMAVLHGLHGRQRWGQLVAPAETLARFGHRVSRAFATDLAEADPRMLAGGEMAGLFAPGGAVLSEGALLVQADLASTLQAIRTEGAAVLHEGPLADRLLSGIARFGGQLGRPELAGFVPRVDEPILRRLGSTRIAFAPWFETQGPYQVLLWEALAARRFSSRPEAERPHLVAEAAARARGAFAAAAGSVDVSGWAGERQASALMADYDAGRHVPPAADLARAAADRRASPAGTSFVVVDAQGGGVACGLTMGRPFGAGRIAGDTGVIPAVRADAAVDDEPLSPILAMNPNTNVLFFVGAGSGPGAATAVTEAAARVLAGDQPLWTVLAAPRAEHRGAPDVAFVEPAAQETIGVPLAQRGHTVERLPAPSLVNAVSCPGGIPRRPETCTVAADPRGHGLDTRVRR